MPSCITSAACFCLLTALATGCASMQQVDLVASGEVKAERAESELIDLSVPSVSRTGDILIVSGTVTRKPGVDGPILGHVQILVFSQEGAFLDELRPLWKPGEIPVTGNRQSSYMVQYGWLPPRGAVIRAVYEEHHHEPPLSSGSGAGGATGGGAIGNSNYTRTPPMLGTPRQTGTPGTPRTGGGSGRK